MIIPALRVEGHLRSLSDTLPAGGAFQRPGLPGAGRGNEARLVNGNSGEA